MTIRKCCVSLISHRLVQSKSPTSAYPVKSGALEAGPAEAYNSAVIDSSSQVNRAHRSLTCMRIHDYADAQNV